MQSRNKILSDWNTLFYSLCKERLAWVVIIDIREWETALGRGGDEYFKNMSGTRQANW